MYAYSIKMPIAWGNHLPRQHRINVGIAKCSYDFNNDRWINWGENAEALTMMAIGV